MKTPTLVHRSRLDGEEVGLNCYIALKGAPEFGKLSIIFNTFSVQNYYLVGILHCKKVCER